MYRLALVVLTLMLVRGSVSASAGPGQLETDPVTLLVTEYGNAQMSKDPVRITAAFAEDGVYVDTQSPNHGERRGKVEITEYFAQLYQSYPDLQLTIDGITSMPDSSRAPYAWVSVSWTFTGTHTGTTPIAGPATDNVIVIHGVDIVSVNLVNQEPTIAEVRSYYDGSDFVRQDQRE